MNRLLVIGVMMLMACQSRKESRGSGKADVVADSIENVAILKKKATGRLDSLAGIAKSKPVWGERLVLSGDFDGDGKRDTLFESYKSKVTGKETNKGYDFTGWDDGTDFLFFWQEWVSEKKIELALVSKHPGINQFVVDQDGLHTGFLYLKNVGDLNKDGTDEIAYILHFLDFSNMNTCHLATYKKQTWQKITDWAVAEFDFQYDPTTQTKPDPKYVFIKPDGRVLLKEFDGAQLNNTNWKTLNTNW